MTENDEADVAAYLKKIASDTEDEVEIVEHTPKGTVLNYKQS